YRGGISSPILPTVRGRGLDPRLSDLDLTTGTICVRRINTTSSTTISIAPPTHHVDHVQRDPLTLLERLPSCNTMVSCQVIRSTTVRTERLQLTRSTTQLRPTIVITALVTIAANILVLCTIITRPARRTHRSTIYLLISCTAFSTDVLDHHRLPSWLSYWLSHIIVPAWHGTTLRPAGYG